MKRTLLFISSVAFAISAMATLPAMKQMPKGLSPFGAINPKTDKGMMKAPAKVTVEELLADPEGTVFSGPYIEELAAFTGFQNSDQGRPDMPTKFFQYYNGCPYTITGVRVIGLFNYWDNDDYDWYACDDRPGYDENYNMTQPVTFEVSFYRIGDDGMPGECVYSQNIELTGRFTGLVNGSNEYASPLMEFIAPLDEEVKLETGYMSFSAVKPEGEAPTCWFSLFTASSSFGYGIINMEPYGYVYAMNPCIFSLMGPGDMAAQKAVKIASVKAPASDAHGTHESVSVSLGNAGAQTLNDITLQLYVDGDLKATETPGITLNSLESRDYMFASRVDISAEGEHQVKVVNVTPGDEKISLQDASVWTSALAEGEICASGAQYPYPEDGIANVKIGSIDNSSDENEGYSDYTDLSTDIAFGDELDLTVTAAEEGGAIGVWVDWNGDGYFNGEGEFIAYIINEDITVVTLPAGVGVTPGKKTLRIVKNTQDYPEASGSYYCGETEDYTINVVRRADDPALILSVAELESNESDASSSLGFDVTNEGASTLDAAFRVEYQLPYIYENRTLAKPAALSPMLSAKKSSRKMQRLADEDNIAYVLHYDGEQYQAVGVGNYSESVFGQYYPAEVLASVKGMSITSIDVFIQDIPEKSSVLIYEMRNGAYEVVAEQIFEPVAESWNRVVLDKPYEINGADIIYAFKATGTVDGMYPMGVDNLPAVRGYGDLCNVGGETWWSMADLGIDHNFCVRANVSGELTPSLSWLSLNTEKVSLQSGDIESVLMSVNRDNLPEGTYEASVVVTSNDPLTPIKLIPVYMTRALTTGIDIPASMAAEVKVMDGKLVVAAAKNVKEVAIYSLDGLCVARATANGFTTVVPLDNCATGIYMVHVGYDDGNADSMKMVIKR